MGLLSQLRELLIGPTKLIEVALVLEVTLAWQIELEVVCCSVRMLNVEIVVFNIQVSF